MLNVNRPTQTTSCTVQSLPAYLLGHLFHSLFRVNNKIDSPVECKARKSVAPHSCEFLHLQSCQNSRL